MIKPSKPRVRVAAGIGSGRISAVYEGASRGPRMNKRGVTGVRGPNVDIASSLATLRARARHATMNQAHAARSKEIYVSNLIGTGLTAHWRDKELQALWDQWIKHCDADGDGSMLGLQVLAAGSQFESGEVLALKRRPRASGRLSIPLQIDLLEGDHLDEKYTEMDSSVVMGVQFKGSERVGYHIHDHHPGDIGMGGLVNARRYYDATDVIHLYRRLRPRQIRGVPELTPVLVRLYEIDEMQDSTLMKQKASALFAWIVRKDSSKGGYTESNNVDFGEETSVSASGGSEQITSIRPGGIHYLEEGESIDFSAPDDIGGNYLEWMRHELRAIAAAIGITYEQLTGDLSGVNYSSIRAGLLEFRRRIELLQLSLMVDKFLNPIATWFLETVAMMGKVSLADYWSKPWEFLPDWRSPTWDWIDPLKDQMGDILSVRSGLDTLKNKHAERNLDHAAVIEQLLIEQAYELVLDTNPSKTTKGGAVQDLSKLTEAVLEA